MSVAEMYSAQTAAPKRTRPPLAAQHASSKLSSEHEPIQVGVIRVGVIIIQLIPKGAE